MTTRALALLPSVLLACVPASSPVGAGVAVEPVDEPAMIAVEPTSATETRVAEIAEVARPAQVAGAEAPEVPEDPEVAEADPSAVSLGRSQAPAVATPQPELVVWLEPEPRLVPSTTPYGPFINLLAIEQNRTDHRLLVCATYRFKVLRDADAPPEALRHIRGHCMVHGPKGSLRRSVSVPAPDVPGRRSMVVEVEFSQTILDAEDPHSGIRVPVTTWRGRERSAVMPVDFRPRNKADEQGRSVLREALEEAGQLPR